MTAALFAFPISSPATFPKQSFRSPGIELASHVISSATAPSLLPVLHRGPATNFYGMNLMKESFGEGLSDHLMTRNFLSSTGNWTPLTPRFGRQGLDGLFVQFGEVGEMRKLLVSEAKFGTSQLGQTQAGQQMSDEWVHARLRKFASRYEHFMQGGEDIVRRGHVPTEASPLTVHFAGGKSTAVWKKGRSIYVQGDAFPTKRELQDRLSQMGRSLRRWAEGRALVRRRIFRYRVEDGQHKFVLRGPKSGASVVENVGVGYETRQVVKGSFEDLPEEYQRALRKQYRKVFAKMGHSGKEQRELVRKSCRDPKFFKEMSRHPRHSFKAGLNQGMWIAGGVAGLGVIVFEVGRTAFGGDDLDWSSTGTVAGIAAVSSMVGYYAGAQTKAFLVGTKVGRDLLSLSPVTSIADKPISTVVGSVAAGSVTALIYVIGMRATGQMGDRQAKRKIVTATGGIAASTGASAAVFMAASTWGTASTGTSIATLSGAAANNATLALLGGGAVSVGGGGMAIGAAVLTATGAAAGAAVAAGIGFVYAQLNQKERRTVVEGRLNFIHDQVRSGNQREWNSYEEAEVVSIT